METKNENNIEKDKASENLEKNQKKYVREYLIENFGRISVGYLQGKFYTNIHKILDFYGLRNIENRNLEKLEKKLSEELIRYLEIQTSGIEYSINNLVKEKSKLNKIAMNLENLENYRKRS